MGFTKKAISVGLSATMLATLLATAFAGSAFAAAAPTPGTITPVSVPVNGTASVTPVTLTYGASGDLATGNLVIALPTGFYFTSTSATTAPTPAGACAVIGAGTYNAGLTTVTYSVTTGNTASCAVSFPALTVGTSTSGATGSVTAASPSVSGTVNVGTLNASGLVLTSQGTLYPWSATPTSASLQANGLSYYTVQFGSQTATDVKALQVSVTGGYFLNGSGTFVGSSSLTYPRTASLLTSTSNVTVAPGSQLWIASTTAGTVLFTVQYTSTSLGTNYDSSYAFTFTGATSTTVSTSYSGTTRAHSSMAALTSSTDLITTTVADTNNNLITSGALVSWTLSGPAVFSGTSAQVDSNNPVGTGGTATATIVSTGVAGTVTIATTVSYLGVTYTLANATVTFVGDVAKAVGSNNNYSIAYGLTTQPTGGSYALDKKTDALSVAVTDAAGNAIGANVSFTYSYTPANIFSLALDATTPYDSTNKVWDFVPTCATEGTATVVITANSSLSTATAATKALTLTCADQLTSSTAGTFTAKAASTTVAPNGTTTITVNVLDDNKLPAPDGTPVLAVTNGVGNVVSSGGTIGSSTTSGGVATFTYLAPANAGSGTVTVFVGSATPASQAITLTIGTPAPAVSYTAASALGVTTSGPFSTATKLPKIGKYVTVKFSFGAANAGKTVIIDVATKTSGVWSAFKGLTTRVANSNGDVFFYWKSSSASWLSIYGDLGGAHSNSVQARWM